MLVFFEKDDNTALFATVHPSRKVMQEEEDNGGPLSCDLVRITLIKTINDLHTY